MSWTIYTPEGNNYIDIGHWGKDHWSTLAYIEARVIDNNGIINNLQMRCNSRLHRGYTYVGLNAMMTDGAKYPTRLQGDIELEKHDDWSCLEDMVAANLVIAQFRENSKYPNEIFGNMEARVELTELGIQVSGMLRAHKAQGGMYAKFQLSKDELKIITDSLNKQEEVMSSN